jgi:phosphatidate phosphatase
MAFVFGHSVTFLLTMIGKKTIGRLRPHFMSICQPSVDPYSQFCSDDKIKHQMTYLQPGVHFQCTFAGQTNKLINESRLSFPSGHTSFAFYAMTFLILFISKNWRWRSLGFMPILVQTFLAGVAWFIGLSRVIDHKHHASDVLAGGLLGSLIALFTFHFLNSFYRKSFLKFKK